MGILVGRLVLAAVFGLAAVAKLADRAGSRRALEAFGIPERLVATGVILVPLAELGVSAALLTRSSFRLGAAVALALLVAFSIVVVANLAAGRRTDCHCFGRLHSSPIGLATLVRNGVLGALSILVMLEGRGPGMSDAAAAGLAGALGLALVVLVVGVARHRPVQPAPQPTTGTTVSRRSALALFATTVVGAALSFRMPRATACGAECRSSSDCPGTCRNCRKQPGVLMGHCH